MLNTQWIHARKRSIESCPRQGSTLSSDLLCLARWTRWLCSGGVDGRIHVWSYDPMVAAKPLLTIAAHQGRVNAIATLQLFGGIDGSCMLLSCGHDGELQCRLLEQKEQQPALLDRPLACFRAIDEEGNAMRVSALECSLQDDSTARVLLGTTTGVLVAACLTVDTSRSVCHIMEQSRVHLFDADDPTSINAIVIPQLSQTGGAAVIVGHSKGLSVVRWHLSLL